MSRRTRLSPVRSVPARFPVVCRKADPLAWEVAKKLAGPGTHLQIGCDGAVIIANGDARSPRSNPAS